MPKVPVARLFFLLGYSLDPAGVWRGGEVEVAEHRDLLPALAHAVERQVDRALRQGLLQGYRATEETSPVVRGRPLPEWRPSRLNARYHHALDLDQGPAGLLAEVGEVAWRMRNG